MDFDVVDFLTTLAGEPARAPEPAAVPSGDPEPQGEPAAGAAAEPAPGPFDGWSLRPDVTGRQGWEPPDLPEADRWWARWTWETLVEALGPAPVGKTVAQEAHRCDRAARVDTLDLPGQRPSQGLLRGVGGV